MIAAYKLSQILAYLHLRHLSWTDVFLTLRSKVPSPHSYVRNTMSRRYMVSFSSYSIIKYCMTERKMVWHRQNIAFLHIKLLTEVFKLHCVQPAPIMPPDFDLWDFLSVVYVKSMKPPPFISVSLALWISCLSLLLFRLWLSLPLIPGKNSFLLGELVPLSISTKEPERCHSTFIKPKPHHLFSMGHFTMSSWGFLFTTFN